MAKKDIDTKKVEHVVTAMLVPLQQLTACVEELRVLLAGGPSIGEQLNEYYAHWGEMHRSAGYAGAYQFNHKVDVPHIKRFLKQLGKEELFLRVERYHRDADDFLKRARHSHGLFVSGINRYASYGGSVAALDFLPVGCKHDPPCKSDQEHTRRQLSKDVF